MWLVCSILVCTLKLPDVFFVTVICFYLSTTHMPSRFLGETTLAQQLLHCYLMTVIKILPGFNKHLLKLLMKSYTRSL